MFDWFLNTPLWNKACALNKPAGPGLQVHNKPYITSVSQTDADGYFCPN